MREQNIAKTTIVETDVTEPDGGGCKITTVEASAVKVAGVASSVVLLQWRLRSSTLG